MLTITDWYGTPGSTGTGGQIFFGNGINLNTQTLSQITFTNINGTDSVAGAMQLASGEIVPLAPVPEPASTLAIAGLGMLGVRTVRRRLMQTAL